MNIDLVGWQLSRNEYALNRAEIQRITRLKTPLAKFTIDCNRVARGAFKAQTGQDGIALPDAVAMAVALDPSIITESTMHRVEVETESRLSRGMTIVDQLDTGTTAGPQKDIWQKAKSPMRLIWKLNAARWLKMLHSALA